MRRGGIKRLLNLAVLLPLVMLSVSGGGLSWFRCQLTGIVSSDRCCPDEDLAAPVERSLAAQARLASADCCTRENLSFAKPPAEVPPPPAHDLASPAIAVAIVLPPSPSTLDRGAALAADAATLSRPPILLVKRSLII